MSLELTVRGEGLAMSITVAGYEFPHIESGSDANWLSGAVELTVGATGRFTASHKLWLFTTDLQQFRDELRVLDSELSGEARLRHLEGQLDLTIKLTNGRGTVEGVVGEHVGAELVFEQIPIDQTYVRQTLEQLETIISAFPARPNPAD